MSRVLRLTFPVTFKPVVLESLRQDEGIGQIFLYDGHMIDFSATPVRRPSPRRPPPPPPPPPPRRPHPVATAVSRWLCSSADPTGR